jgi:hypothetical protein
MGNRQLGARQGGIRQLGLGAERQLDLQAISALKSNSVFSQKKDKISHSFFLRGAVSEFFREYLHTYVKDEVPKKCIQDHFFCKHEL